MAIIKWTPFADSMMDEFFEGWPMSRSDHFIPAVDVYEDKDNVVVETPLTGIDPAQVKVEIEDSILKISGASDQKSEVDEKNYYRREIRSGQFYRSVALPKVVDADRANAVYDKGILKITVPKKDEAKPKSVAVKIEK